MLSAIFVLCFQGGNMVETQVTSISDCSTCVTQHNTHGSKNGLWTFRDHSQQRVLAEATFSFVHCPLHEHMCVYEHN